MGRALQDKQPLTRQDVAQSLGELGPDAKAAIVELKPGEGVWKGISTNFSDDHLAFEYYIWNEGDGNCCPTAGKVTGTYKISKETKFDAGKYAFLDQWTMVVDKAVREPVRK